MKSIISALSNYSYVWLHPLLIRLQMQQGKNFKILYSEFIQPGTLSMQDPVFYWALSVYADVSCSV